MKALITPEQIKARDEAVYDYWRNKPKLTPEEAKARQRASSIACQKRQREDYLESGVLSSDKIQDTSGHGDTCFYEGTNRARFNLGEGCNWTKARRYE